MASRKRIIIAIIIVVIIIIAVVVYMKYRNKPIMVVTIGSFSDKFKNLDNIVLKDADGSEEKLDVDQLKSENGSSMYINIRSTTKSITFQNIAGEPVFPGRVQVKLLTDHDDIIQEYDMKSVMSGQLGISLN